MKSYLSLLLALAVCANAEPAAKDPVTARDLAAREPNRSLSVLARENPAAPQNVAVHTAGSLSIIAQSEILHDGTHWTLVPKGAVLFVPERKKTNVGARPAGELLPWLEFLTRNPAWVSSCETSFAQAAGEEPFPAAKVGFWQMQDKVIIAVHRGGPISVARRTDKTTNAPIP